MMRRLGIKARVLLLALLPITVISIALTGYFILSRLQDMDRAVEEQGQAMARQLAQACEYGLFIGEAALLEDLARGLERDDLVRVVRIADRHGKVWVQLGHTSRLPALGVGAQGSMLRTRDMLYITEPVYSKPLPFPMEELGEMPPQAIGQVTLGLDLKPTLERQRQILRTSFLITAGVLAVTMLMAWRLGRDIVRPIGLLAEAVERIGQGQLQVRLPGELGGEFSILERGITRMAEELRAFYDTLQIRIQEATAKLGWQATHDPLTGLVNRSEFAQQVDKARRSAAEEGRRHTLVFMDLDQFKVVNDTSGHKAGDELLRQLAAQLRRALRSSDVLARLGGDEFGVLFLDCSVEVGMRLAEALRRVVEGFRFHHGERVYAVGVSMGLVAIDADSPDVDELLAAADAACYVAKEGGRNRIHRHHEADKDVLRRRGEMEWASRITRALDEGRMRIYCQYLKPLRQGDGLRHYELLLRMVDPEHNVIPPMAFLPAAERYQLAALLDRWVLDQVIESCAGTLVEHPDVILSLNISGASLGDEGFQKHLRQRLAEHPGVAASLCLEITETVAIANLDRALELIFDLRGLGCRFALDDFGSGLSSFAYLRSLPVDYLKIDGTFVRDMHQDPVDAAMVEAIHKVARLMGVRTVAEYVEDEASLRMLQEMGVDYAQGYLIHAPEPLEEVCGGGRGAAPPYSGTI